MYTVFANANSCWAMMFVMFRMQFDEFLIKCSYMMPTICAFIHFDWILVPNANYLARIFAGLKVRKFFVSFLAFGICVRIVCVYVYILNDWFWKVFWGKSKMCLIVFRICKRFVLYTKWSFSLGILAIPKLKCIASHRYFNQKALNASPLPLHYPMGDDSISVCVHWVLHMKLLKIYKFHIKFGSILLNCNLFEAEALENIKFERKLNWK